MLYLIKDLDDDDYVILSTTEDIVNCVFVNEENCVWHSASQLLIKLPSIPHNAVQHTPYHEWIINSGLNLQTVFIANSLEELVEQIINSPELFICKYSTIQKPV